MDVCAWFTKSYRNCQRLPDIVFLVVASNRLTNSTETRVIAPVLIATVISGASFTEPGSYDNGGTVQRVLFGNRLSAWLQRTFFLWMTFSWILLKRRSGVPIKTLVRADPYQLYQPDHEGSFPIHVTTTSGAYSTIEAMIAEYPAIACLRDFKGRTFIQSFMLLSKWEEATSSRTLAILHRWHGFWICKTRMATPCFTWQ